MDSWSTFQHMSACDVVTDPASGTPLSDWGPRTAAGGQANPPTESLFAGRAKARASSEARGAGSREKPLAISAPIPYRERTHVVKESILR